MIEEMNRFPLFNYAGAFPVNKKSAQSAMMALKHSIELLTSDNTHNTALWIFPQGIIRPPHYRPIEFQTGMAYIAQNVVKKIGGVNLVPLSFEYCFLREHRPEVLVDIGEPIVLTDTDCSRHDLTRQLEESFSAHCTAHFEAISKGEVSDYKRDEIIEVNRSNFILWNSDSRMFLLLFPGCCVHKSVCPNRHTDSRLFCRRHR